MPRTKPNKVKLFREGPSVCPFCKGKIIQFVRLMPLTWKAECGHCEASFVITAAHDED